MTSEEKDILKENNRIATRKYRESEENRLKEKSRLQLKQLNKTKEENNISKEKEKIAKRKYRLSKMSRSPLFGLAAKVDTADFDENSNDFFK